MGDRGSGKAGKAGSGKGTAYPSGITGSPTTALKESAGLPDDDDDKDDLLLYSTPIEELESRVNRPQS